MGASIEKGDLVSCTCWDEKNSHKMRCFGLDSNSSECNIDELCMRWSIKFYNAVGKQEFIGYINWTIKLLFTLLILKYWFAK